MKAYWFSKDGVSNQGSRYEVGKTYRVTGEIVPCQNGLHGSEHPSDALAYAGCATLDLVELSGAVVPHGNPVDKCAARKRKHLARIDATELLRAHARWCALQVIHLWKAPAVIREYLETGDESKRDAAWAAARAAQRADLLRRVEKAFAAMPRKEEG